MNLLLVRSQGQPLFSSYLWSNKKLLAAFGISAVCVLNIVYNPVVQGWFHSGSLNLADWLTAFAAAAIYTAVRLFHIHTKATSRNALIKQHGREKILAHLQKTSAVH
jgi:hypothetical protein